MQTRTMDLGRRLLIWAAAATALAAVFMAYLQPDMVVDLANRFWSCF
jgi:formate hydrogenlyase subunit 3/multisubunit Na+/H+ antiporter MnhD subunit